MLTLGVYYIDGKSYHIYNIIYIAAPWILWAMECQPSDLRLIHFNHGMQWAKDDIDPALFRFRGRLPEIETQQVLPLGTNRPGLSNPLLSLVKQTKTSPCSYRVKCACVPNSFAFFMEIKSGKPNK